MQTQDTISSWLSHSDNQSDNPAGPLFIAGAVATETALTNTDGRITITMPHPERSFQKRTSSCSALRKASPASTSPMQADTIR